MQSTIVHNSHATQARVGSGQSMPFKDKSQPAGSPTGAFRLLVAVVRDMEAWKICNPREATRWLALPTARIPPIQRLERESMRYPAQSWMTTTDPFAGRKNMPHFHHRIHLLSETRVTLKRRSCEPKQVQVVIKEVLVNAFACRFFGGRLVRKEMISASPSRP